MKKWSAGVLMFAIFNVLKHDNIFFSSNSLELENIERRAKLFETCAHFCICETFGHNLLKFSLECAQKILNFLTLMQL